MTDEECAEKLARSTQDLGLSVRTTNTLEKVGVMTVGDLLNCTVDQLIILPNIGEKTLAEIFDALAAIGFVRKPDC